MAHYRSSTQKDQQLDFYTSVNSEPGRILTTNSGLRICDTDNSLHVGERGPALLEDFHFREKLTSFDHERIPERVVHARGCGAHGYFQVYRPIPELTSACFLNDTSRRTPVFVRFSNVLGSRGSADTVRDVRGFATRFYTEEGLFDLVGNNIPVFFIQDAIKFPDLIHAAKPEPHNEIPQAQTAHDNFWDYISLVPESAHLVMWLLSDRGLPRSYRMMNGFGVNTFVLVDAQGSRRFVKFHWRPLLGVHSLAWDEAQKLAGQDPDFHRRDLWEAIEAGTYPEYELGFQVVDEQDEHKFDFDLLDATKLIPEEYIPIRWVGKMTLTRNPSEHFSEVEQIAFCPQHIVPGIDFSDDPLLQGRNFSYLDTQLSRLGSANFMEIPINRPLCPIVNNQRNGFMRQKIISGRINYWPNRESAPHPAPLHGGDGFISFPERVLGTKTRLLRSPKFAEYYNQATMFWNSQTAAEKEHLISAAVFELGKCNDRGVLERMLDTFNKIDHEFGRSVAMHLGMSAPDQQVSNHGRYSNSLSIERTNLANTIATRKIAILVADGFDLSMTSMLISFFHSHFAVCHLIAPHRGFIRGERTTKGHSEHHYASFSLSTAKSTMFDAVLVPGGSFSIQTLSKIGSAIYFVREAFKHCKPIAAFDQGVVFLRSFCMLPQVRFADFQSATGGKIPSKITIDQGVVTSTDSDSIMTEFAPNFADVIAHHRFWNRDVSSVPA